MKNAADQGGCYPWRPKAEVNKHAPRKQISQSKQRQFSKPWITDGILKSIKNKQGMYRTHFLSNNPAKIAEYKKIC